MIASKLILFFCFYLLLDSSLGQSLVGKNKKLFENAIDYGAKYGGKLGELGSQWKQLLIQLVQAKRKVGLSKYQLARFNDSGTEEVDLGLNDTYADKVAELVEIRTEDIGSTQKYIDELEILQNEIALTMIVKMDEIEEKFKPKNVKKKVKEAKDNGITDTDIKEILFAEFFDTGGGLSFIGKAAASTADALLSSIRNGMNSLLDGDIFGLGIIQYGNGGVNGAPGGPPEGGRVPDGAGGGANGAPGGPPEGGRFPGGAAGGGGEPPEGGGGPPCGPPGDHEDDDGNEDDDEDVPERAVGGVEGTDGDAPLGRPRPCTEEELNEIDEIVSEQINPLIPDILRAGRTIIDLQVLRANGYTNDSSLQVPEDDDLNSTARLALYTHRVEHFRNLLQHTLSDLINENNANIARFRPRLLLARENYNYYSNLYLGNTSLLDLPQPKSFAELELTEDSPRMWFLLFDKLRESMNKLADRYRAISLALKTMQEDLIILWHMDKIRINNLNLNPPNSTPTSSEGAVDGTEGAVGGTEGAVGGTEGAVGGTEGAVGGTEGAVGGTEGVVGGTEGAVGGTEGANGCRPLGISGPYTIDERSEVNQIVNDQIFPLTMEIERAEGILVDLEIQRLNGYENDSSLRVPEHDDLNYAVSLALHTHRIDHFRHLLEHTVNDLIERNNAIIESLQSKLMSARENYNYYSTYHCGSTSRIKPPPPESLVEFRELPYDSNRMRYFLALSFAADLNRLADSFNTISEDLKTIQGELLDLIEADEMVINNLIPPNSTPTPTEDDE